jgi:ATP-dependent Clp protease ATP-binding subunit ClpC
VPFTRDLTAAARRGELPPIYGREQELDQVLTILLQRERNCPLCVGEPGVGKTAIAEKLATASAREELPRRLRGLRVLALDLPQLLAECSCKGAVEQKVTRIMDGLAADPQLLLFADELHTLAEARGDIPVLEMMKPRLARGLRVMGATTHADFKASLATDEALVRRFDTVNVDEPSPGDTEQILRSRLPLLEEHHGVHVAQDMVAEVVRLADEYFANRRRPDKALMLLDRSMAAEALRTERRAS